MKKASFIIVIVLTVVGIRYLWHIEPKLHYPCAFCNEVVIEKQKFYEDEYYIALINYAPIVEGYGLIIPKFHRENIEELSTLEQQDLIPFINHVHHIVFQTFDVEPYLLLQKNGREVGQTVPHVHFHYIPRKANEAQVLPFVMKYVSWVFKPHYSDKKTKEVVSALRQNTQQLNNKDSDVSVAG